MSGVLTPTSEETTDVRIHLAELRQRAAETRSDVRAHDGKIETLQVQVAEVKQTLHTVVRVLAWGLGTVGTAVVGALAAILTRLYAG
jgi:hypothetical protein